MALGLLLTCAGQLGLVCLLILGLNCVHGLRINSRWLNLISAAILATGSLLGFWYLCQLAMMGVDEWPRLAWLLMLPCALTSLVGLPVVTARRLRRLPPAGSTLRVTKRPPASADERERWIGSGWRSTLFRIPRNEAFEVQFEDWTVERRQFPPALEGLSILLLGDFHFSKAYRPAFFEEMVAEAAREEVDLVLFAGDMIDDLDCLAWVVPVLSTVRARLGKFAVLGNHDYLQDAAAVNRELERAGFELIEGRWGQFERAGEVVAIGGTCAPWGPEVDPAKRPAEAAATILLSHSPDLLYKAASWGVDLMLSGHTHGGQVRLPVVGPLLMPSRYSRRFEAGFYSHGGTLLYVSRGLGAEVPLRLGCAPEVTRLVLRAAGKSESLSGTQVTSSIATLEQ
jgi:predicted MPP superfamily phosphohydrolase